MNTWEEPSGKGHSKCKGPGVGTAAEDEAEREAGQGTWGSVAMPMTVVFKCGQQRL